MPKQRAIRVLHVVAEMNRGGLETWLMNVMRRIDRQRVQFDFCVGTARECDYDAEIRSLGGVIKPCAWGRNLIRFGRSFRALLCDNDYDIVHSHAYSFSGVVLRHAEHCGVQHRFSHLHTTGDGCKTTLFRVMYRSLMRNLIKRHSTRIFGCSRGALGTLVGASWEEDPRCQVLHYGVDLSGFAQTADGDGVRAELGLPCESKIVLHVGRFVEAKNHHRLVHIFDLISERRDDTHLVLVGDGGLRDSTLQLVSARNLQQRVHFVGVRRDVPQLMQASDVMVMPSIREGMPVTLLEATAAGLPAVMTDMPGMREANDVCSKAVLLGLDRPDDEWADEVLRILDEPRPDALNALEEVRSSPFSSEVSARAVQEVYLACR